jgi:Amt family ammonium transporter
MMKLSTKLGLAAALVALPSMGVAQDAAAAPDINPYIFTTLLFLIGGFLVFWMAAGFAMLEAGLVRSKNVTMQLTKNISLFSIAALMYWLIGFNLMYPGEWMIDGWMGPWFSITALEPVGLAASVRTSSFS